MMNDVPYEEGEVELYKEDRILLFTDGVSEAMNKEEEEFEEKRIEEILSNNKDLDAGELIGKIIEEVQLFCGDVPQNDDITMIAVHMI